MLTTRGLDSCFRQGIGYSVTTENGPRPLFANSSPVPQQTSHSSTINICHSGKWPALEMCLFLSFLTPATPAVWTTQAGRRECKFSRHVRRSTLTRYRWGRRRCAPVKTAPSSICIPWAADGVREHVRRFEKPTKYGENDVCFNVLR